VKILNRRKLKVAIIGGAAREEQFLGQHEGPGWEIWGLNSIRPDGREKGWQPIRWARMFNLHRFEHLNRDAYQYILWDTAWSKANPQIPIYVIDTWHGLLERERLFPVASLARLTPRGGRYHAGSFDMLVAYAILEGAAEIALHGIGLALDSWREEPISARACLEYWCGVAEGRGIRVTASEDCDIFAQYHLVKSHSVYGYDDIRLIVDPERERGKPR